MELRSPGKTEKRVVIELWRGEAHVICKDIGVELEIRDRDLAKMIEKPVSHCTQRWLADTRIPQ